MIIFESFLTNTMKKRQITLKDIAKALDLSVSTVSRSLSDHPDISPGTKVLVQRFAKEHKYKPNAFALGLKTNANKTIGVIIPEIVHFFFSSVLSGMQDEAEKDDFNIIICQSNEDYAQEVKATQTLLAAQVQGILVSSSKTTTCFEHFQEIVDNNIPLVFFDRICTGINTDRVVVDDYQGAFTAVCHLIGQGCRRIVFLGASSLLAIANNRRMGYEDALRKHGIVIDEECMPVCDTIELARRIIPLFLAKEQRPDAFFCVNDEVASFCIRMIKQAGIRVPEDISVCGFTNSQIAELIDPALTTVDQHGFELGATAMRLVIDRINGEETKDGIVSRVIKTKLIIRESTR